MKKYKTFNDFCIRHFLYRNGEEFLRLYNNCYFIVTCRHEEQELTKDCGFAFSDFCDLENNEIIQIENIIYKIVLGDGYGHVKFYVV